MLVGGQSLKYWVACLDSEKANLRASAVSNLPAFGAAAVEPLIERLDDDSSQVVEAATSVIRRIGPAGVGQLAAGLRRGGTPFRRIRIIEVLQTIGPPASDPANPLIAAQLSDHDVSGAAADYFVFCGPDAHAITVAAGVLPLGE